MVYTTIEGSNPDSSLIEKMNSHQVEMFEVLYYHCFLHKFKSLARYYRYIVEVVININSINKNQLYMTTLSEPRTTIQLHYKIIYPSINKKISYKKSTKKMESETLANDT